MAIISRTYGNILAAILAWLGISCNQWGVEKYGTPSATYKAKGVVVSETDGAPIEGIRAVLKYQTSDTWEMDVVHTNGKGVFNLKTYDGYGNLYVELTDIDGDKNGSFRDTTVVADFSHVKFKGNIPEGREVEKDLGIIKMKPKK